MVIHDIMVILAIVAGFVLAGYLIWYFVLRWRNIVPPEPKRPKPPKPPIFAWLDSMEWARRLLMKLMRAGVGLKPSEFVGITGGISLVLAVVLYLIVRVPGILFLGLALGIVGSWIYLESSSARRLAAFNIQLPDTLSLISAAVRSGAGFDRAAALVRDEMPPPIADEFGRMLAETSVGVPLEDSLAHMVDRVRSYDLELVIVAVTVNRQVGGNLAEVLDKIGSMIRERIRLQREVSALTVEGRMSGIVLLIAPYVVAGLILMLNPNYLSVIFTKPLGQALVAGAFVLQILGALSIRAILRTDY